MYQGKYVSNTPKARKPRQPRRKTGAAKPSKKGTILFYSFYGAFIVLFLVALGVALNPLRQWLTKYEASQPQQKCEEVFQQLFENPDWENLYTMSGQQDTTYEGKEAYAAYMKKLVGDTKLTYMETSAGLSGDRKYIVKAGETKVATFKLTGGADSDVDIPEWSLGQVEIFFTRTESVIVTINPGQTVYINGVALDNSAPIRTTETMAERYLPEGIHGYRTMQLRLDGLLVQPEVTVKNPDGSEATVHRAEQTNQYYTDATTSPAITNEATALASNAAQTYAKYMLRATSLSEVAKLFDTSSETYRIITNDESIVQSYAKYSIDDLTIGGYYQYSDSLFSVWVNLVMNVTRTNGTVKEYPIASTFFFTKNASGKWLVTNMINSDAQQKVEKVRLTFVNGSETLASMLVDTTVQQITTPAITAPEGKVFTGWAKETIDDRGNTTYTVVFTPDENNTVYLADGVALDPMTIYALFENPTTEAQ